MRFVATAALGLALLAPAAIDVRPAVWDARPTNLPAVQPVPVFDAVSYPGCVDPSSWAAGSFPRTMVVRDGHSYRRTDWSYPAPEGTWVELVCP